MGSSSLTRGENNKYLKPPPSRYTFFLGVRCICWSSARTPFSPKTFCPRCLKQWPHVANLEPFRRIWPLVVGPHYASLDWTFFLEISIFRPEFDSTPLPNKKTLKNNWNKHVILYNSREREKHIPPNGKFGKSSTQNAFKRVYVSSHKGI